MKKEIKKTKLKPRSKAERELMITFLKGVNRRLDWMIRYTEIWSIEAEIRELKDKVTDEIDLEKLSQLEKRVDAVEKILQSRRFSIFSERTVIARSPSERSE